MYPQTKQYIIHELLKLVDKTNDIEHKGGKVSIFDIELICKEISRSNIK